MSRGRQPCERWIRSLTLPHRPEGARSLRSRVCRLASASLGTNSEFERYPKLKKKKGPRWGPFSFLARPERFELPTTWFEARYSIQLSYGRIVWYYVSRVSVVHTSSATRCRYSSPRSARRARPLGGSLVAFAPGRACSASPLTRRPSLTQLSYGRIVWYYVSRVSVVHTSSATRCRYSSPRSARRARPLGGSLVAFAPGRACSASPLTRRPSLTQLSYGRIVWYYVSCVSVVHTSSATRCRYSSPRYARRAQPLGGSLVAFAPGRACSASPLTRRPSLTQLSYGRIVWYYVSRVSAVHTAALRAATLNCGHFVHNRAAIMPDAGPGANRPHGLRWAFVTPL